MRIASALSKEMARMNTFGMRLALIVAAALFAMYVGVPSYGQEDTATPTAAPTASPTAEAEGPETATPVPSSQQNVLSLYDDNGNGRITCAEARKHGIAPVYENHPAYQYMRDSDNDGVVCEPTDWDTESVKPTSTVEVEGSRCFRVDGGHNGLEEQIRTILEKPVEFENTYISPLTTTVTDENGNTEVSVRTGVSQFLVILTADDKNMMAWGTIGTLNLDETESNSMVCDSEILGIAEFELGEPIYVSEETATTPTPVPASTPVSATDTIVATATPAPTTQTVGDDA